MFPDVEFYAVDAIAKKIKVVNGVKEALGLTNIIAEQKRAEKVQGKFDFVVSRESNHIFYYLKHYPF